jgi:glutathione synthase
MKIGFLVNKLENEFARYTTIRLGMTATNRGHDVWFIDVGDLAYDLDDFIKAHGRRAAGKQYKSSETYFKDLISNNKSRCEKISIETLDILFLRNDPSIEGEGRGWAKNVGINFGRIASKHGVIVLNDPNGLSKASNKMYYQQLPEEVRLKTIITRNRDEIKAFAKKQKKIVLKPLAGSGGKNVFLVSSKDIGNINQIIDTVSREGYVIAQEYAPLAANGDIRLFLMNGMPLRIKGKYAAFLRKNLSGDIRSNVQAGANSEHAVIDQGILKVAEIIRPKMVQDGMFLVGIDIVGDKILEVNVFTPGGLGKASSLQGVNFMSAVIKALERKVEYMGYYRRKFNNNEMATL